jgi:Uma2 family endonuclease
MLTFLISVKKALSLFGWNSRSWQCPPFQPHMKLTPAEDENSTYPEILVICWPLIGDSPSVESAMVIIEVLSPTIWTYDSDEKWSEHQKIEDLRYYALADPTRLHIVLYSRSDTKGDWRFKVIDSISGRVVKLVGKGDGTISCP